MAVHEDLMAADVIEDPYTYFGMLREEDPAHWNPLYETWVITRYDDVVWSLRRPEFFSSEVFLRDPKPHTHRSSMRTKGCMHLISDT